MKPGDAILTIGLIGLGLFSAYWIAQQYQMARAGQSDAANASINLGELRAAAELNLLDKLLHPAAPTATPNTSTSSGQT